MFKDENGIKNIRMGYKNNFIKGVILSDDSIIQNMQCDINAKIPTDEELDKIDKENSKRKQDECFLEFERKEIEIEEITDMLWLVYEDYCEMKNSDLYTKADNYDRLSRYLINIFSLLHLRQTEMKKFIDDVYDENKAIKLMEENICK